MPRPKPQTPTAPFEAIPGLLSVAIQAHPARRRMVARLIDQLGPVPVAWSRQPDTGRLDVWDTHRRAMAMAADVPFHAVLQDDCIIGRDFYRRLGELVERHGDQVAYGLFFRFKGGRRFAEFNDAARAGRSQGYVTWHRLQWAVGSVVPTWMTPELLPFCDRIPHGKEGEDDLRMSVFFADRGIQVVYPLPSLVSHRDRGVGITGRRNAGRVAWLFE